MPKAEKLTKRGLFRTPGFKGHFENYYFDVVTRAIGSLFEEQKEHLQYLLNGMKQTKERKEQADKDEGESSEAHELSTVQTTTPESSNNPAPNAAKTSQETKEKNV